jgi:hypothetical protein
VVNVCGGFDAWQSAGLPFRPNLGPEEASITAVAIESKSK